jgi:hypothetical protein
MKIGTEVTVQRDEKKYPPRGTWLWYRGKKGVVTGTSLGEIGVSFSRGSTADSWFRRYELKERK